MIQSDNSLNNVRSLILSRQTFILHFAITSTHQDNHWVEPVLPESSLQRKKGLRKVKRKV